MEKRVALELRGRNPSQVKELNLDNCRSTAIMGLTDEYTSLEVLSLNNVGLTTLKGFPTLPKLRKLELSDNRISNGLNFLSGCKKITHLNLSGNKIKDLETLKPLEQFPNLKFLDLFNNEVTTIDDYRSKVFAQHQSLQYLDGFDKADREAEDSEGEDEDEMNGNNDSEEEDLDIDLGPPVLDSGSSRPKDHASDGSNRPKEKVCLDIGALELDNESLALPDVATLVIHEGSNRPLKELTESPRLAQLAINDGCAKQEDQFPLPAEALFVADDGSNRSEDKNNLPVILANSGSECPENHIFLPDLGQLVISNGSHEPLVIDDDDIGSDRPAEECSSLPVLLYTVYGILFHMGFLLKNSDLEEEEEDDEDVSLRAVYNDNLEEESSASSLYEGSDVEEEEDVDEEDGDDEEGKITKVQDGEENAQESEQESTRGKKRKHEDDEN